MKAAQLQEYGPADGFRIVDVPKPAPGPKEALIRVKYAGLRWGDIMARRGEPARRHNDPWVPGQEAFGIVEEIGDQVTGFAPGDAVIGTPLEGTFAEWCVVPAARLAKVPPGVPGEKMLIYAINMPVAYMCMYTWGHIQPGETALVHAAAGGVGQLCVQVIKRRGSNNRVIALAGTDEKVQGCLDNGADYAINYKTADYVTEVKRITDGAGVDIVLNGVAGPTLKTDPTVIRPLGRWIIFGGAAGYTPINTFRFSYSSITVMPFSIIPFRNTPHYAEAVAFTNEWVQHEELLTPTAYPLDRIVQAQLDLEEGRTQGKVVLQVG